MIRSRFYHSKELVPIQADRESGVRGVSEQVSEGCPNPVRGVSEGVRECPESVRMDVRGRNIGWKTANNKPNLTVWDWIYVFLGGTGVQLDRLAVLTLTFSIIIGACMSTANHLPYSFQAQVYAIALIACMITDPIRIIGRMLAPQSRFIVGGLAVTFIILLHNMSVEFGIMFFAIASLLMWAIYKLNRVWMAGYLWMMTDNVRTALVLDEYTEGIRNWQDIGKRECRTILSEMGCDFNEFVLESYSKQAYICGFYSGHNATIAANRRAKNAEEALASARKEADDLREQAEKYKHDAEQAEAEMQQMNWDYVKPSQSVQSLEEEIVQEDLSEDVEHRAAALLGSGESIRKVMAITGLKKNQVEKIKKQYDL